MSAGPDVRQEQNPSCRVLCFHIELMHLQQEILHSAKTTNTTNAENYNY